MPLYEYGCECGNKLEALRSIGDRHSVICECGRVPELSMSALGKVLIATPFTVVAGDGTVLSRTQTTEKIPYAYQTPDGTERRL